MNFKTTLVMLVLLAGIAGAYLWTRATGPGSSTSTATPPEALVTGREFFEITLDQDGQTIVLTNEDGRWWQTEPVRFPVTGEAVETLVNAGLSLTPLEVFTFPDDDPIAAADPEEALASFGLASPRATVTYRSDTGTHTLKLGQTNIAGSGYLQKSGNDEVVLVNAALHAAAIDADPQTWWPTELPTLDSTRVNRIAVSSGAGNIELTRAAEGWSLRRDGGERANTDAVLRLAATAQQIKPLGYIDRDAASLGRYGLDEPRLILVTADATGAKQTLRIGQPADLQRSTVYATWSDTDTASPVVFVIPARLAEALDVSRETLRDARVVTAMPGSIRGQKVNRVGRDTIEMRQRPDGNGLTFIEPKVGYEPDPERSAEWLATLTDLQPIGFAKAPREAQAPIALIELLLTGGRSEHVRLYADRDGRDDVLLAVRESEAVAALISRDQLTPLLAPAITLRNRRLPDVENAEELRLSRDDGQVFTFVQDHHDNTTPWRLDYDDSLYGSSWEAAQFAELWRWLESPKVEAWTSMSELPRGPIARLSLGPEKPAYVVNIDQRLGERTDLPGVFKLPAEVAALFGEEYRTRMLLPYRPDQITRVDLGIEPTGVEASALPPAATLIRDEQGILVDAQGQRYLDQAECAGLINTLAGLTAKRFIEPLLPEQHQTPIKYWQVQTADGQTRRLVRYNHGVWSLEGDRYFFIEVEADRQLTRKDTAWGQALVLPETGSAE